MKTNRSFRLPILALGLAALGLAPAAQAQISMTTLGSPVTENFNGLSSTVSTNLTWTDNSTVAGYYSTRTTYNVATGSSNAGALYSFGVAGVNAVTDRALGGIGSGGTGTFYWAGRYVNNTGSTVNQVAVAFTGEQWRDGGATTPVAQTMVFEYQIANAGTITDADTPSTGWTAVTALNFTSPTFTNTTTGAALDGNAAANRTAKSANISVSLAVGQEIWIRWTDINDGGNDHGMAIDDISVTPSVVAGPPNLSISDVSLNEGNAGITNFTFAVTLSAPAGAGGVTFDIATADGTATTADNDYAANSLTGQSIAAGSTGPYNFTVQVNGDTTAEANQTFFVNVTNVTGATVLDGQGQGTIVNDDVTVVKIHDVQGNGAATPIPGATVTVEGIVTGDYQGANELSGFFLQEENADVDADPATSEGIFVFCSGCPTAVAEGQKVQVTGTVSEFFNNTEITASTALSVTVTNAGNNLALITPSTIDLPVVGVIDDYYERFEDMKVTFVDTLTVGEYFEMARYGTVELFEGGRPRQFTEANTPSVAGYTAWLDTLNRRRVILDDTNNIQNFALPPTVADGFQAMYYPHANGGLSVGTQGTDFFRGGDTVSSLTGILDWSFAGLTGTDAWRIRPTNANPAVFTPVNTRPSTPPAVGGTIKASSMNLLNYFTTIDTTSSTSSGPCGPSGTLDCRGADSNAELIRQRERVSIVICTLNADVYGLNELENTTPSATITDLLGAVNTRCGGAHPYAFANTGGTLGTDAIRVQQIYRTGVLSPVGSPLVDLDPVHNRPPTAQTYDVVDATNPAFGQRFTVIANHFKSKGCPGTGADADAGDGQSCFNGTRVAQANRLLAWVTSTVLPAAGDPDVLLLGDFNSNAKEDPVTAILGGGYTDTEVFFQGANAYSYLFDGQIGHLDYAFASTSLLSQVTGADAWHINADENPLFDYSDEIKDVGESAFEEKPDGSALTPPRVVYQSGTPWRASDHDPVLVGLFKTADIAITKTDSPDPVVAGANITYTITVTNNGPSAASTVAWSDTLPAGTTFVSQPAVGGWSCTTPAVGAAGTVNCSNASFAVGSSVFTLTVAVAPATAAGTVLSNTATVTAATPDPTPGNNSATATTTVSGSADVSITKTDSPDPVTAGANLTYTVTVSNAGPSNAAGVSWTDTLPAGTSFVSLPAVGGWSCTTGATVTCSNASMAVGSSVFTLTVNVGSGVAAATVLSNTASVTTTSTDPVPANNSATATTTVAASADLSVTKTDSPDPVTAGANLTYTITVQNAGPSNAASAALADTLPANTTFVSLSPVGGWSCTTPAVGAGGTVNCSNASFAPGGSAVFTLVVNVAASATGSLSNTATVSATTTDPNPANNSATATTGVGAAADLSVTKTDSPDPVQTGQNLTYTITVANAGPSAAAAAALSDTLPTGTTFVSLSPVGGWSCTTPAVGAGGTVSCSNASFAAAGNAVFTLVVAVGPAAANPIVNTATVSTSTTDPNPANNSATASTVVDAVADLMIEKVTSQNPATAGTDLTYTITVSNGGPSNASTVSFSDTLPAGTTFVSLSPLAGWSCTTPAVGAGGTITCSNPSVAVGNGHFTLVVHVASAAPASASIANTVTVTSTTADPDSTDHSSTATVSVIAPASLSATKSVAGATNPGGTVLYHIEISNAGPADQADLTGDELTDVLPPELILVSATASSGSAAANLGTNTVTWNGSVAVGEIVEIDIEATIDPAAPDGASVSNQASFRWDADGDGTSEATGSTDDPAQGGGADPTVFVVGGAEPIVDVPVLDHRGLLALVALIAAVAIFRLRR